MCNPLIAISYVCSKSIKTYDHFNEPSTCPLWDNFEERHEEEISKAAIAAKKAILEANPDLDPEKLNVEVSNAVKKAEAERIKRAVPKGRGVPGAAPVRAPRGIP